MACSCDTGTYSLSPPSYSRCRNSIAPSPRSSVTRPRYRPMPCWLCTTGSPGFTSARSRTMPSALERARVSRRRDLGGVEWCLRMLELRQRDEHLRDGQIELARLQQRPVAIAAQQVVARLEILPERLGGAGHFAVRGGAGLFRQVIEERRGRVE